MNKSSLKIFAVEGRKILKEKIERQLRTLGIYEKEIKFGNLQGEKVEIYGVQHRRKAYDALIKKYNEIGYSEFVEECAYTWFNRLTALAYMEINGYINEHIIFSTTSKSDPDILDNYMDADFFENFSDEIKNIVHTLKDENEREKMYPILIEGKCDELSNIMPFMFTKSGDYTELLFPEGLLMDDSLLFKLRNELEESKNKEGLVPVELIGWLYQFYNSEKKDEVFEGLKKNKKITKENIPAATQLFTPKWIVQYMVENSLGKLAIESLGVSEGLKSSWKYYIDGEKDSNAEKLNIEDIKILDPAMGSGHMLTYSFDLLFNIYDDLGWGKKDAVLSILKNNIYGLEIDNRAGQLASFAIMMKGREKLTRLFRVLERIDNEEKFTLNTFTIVESNIISEQTRDLIKDNSLSSLEILIDNFKDGKEYGSILKLESLSINLLKDEIEKLKETQKASGQGNLFSANATNWDFDFDVQKLEKLIEQQKIMESKFDVVVSNPPYMGSKGFSDKLKKYVEKNYKDSKADLFAVFIEKCSEFTKENRFTGMITMQSWMFLSSFEKLRKNLIDFFEFNSLNHLGTRAFEEIGGEVVQTVSWITKKRVSKIKGTYIRLVNYNNAYWKEKEFFNKENYFQANQKDFEKIPGSPIAYWVSNKIREIFQKEDSLKKIACPKAGITSGDNELFMKSWNEVDQLNILKENKKIQYYFHNKGGEMRKWYGNKDLVLRYDESSLKEMITKKGFRHDGKENYFKEGITWSKISSSNFSARYSGVKCTFDSAGTSCFPIKNEINYILGIMNSKISINIFKILSPTLSFTPGDISKLPIISSTQEKKENINQIVQQNIDIAKDEWNSRETSWDFEKLGLINGSSLKNGYNLYCDYWRENFFKIHNNEEELNRMFIEIYGLQDEMDEKVLLIDITLLKKESNIIDNKLLFNREELIKQLLSYGIGCIMGRYSIDKPGLIMANSDDIMTIENGHIVVRGKDGELRHEIVNPRFIPVANGIVPFVKDETFENDIVVKIVEFIKSIYGEETLEENLDFIGEALGKKESETSRDVIRKYFIKDFYKDHVQRYKKRPIYWMMTSGKRDAFSSLIYLHRYEENSVGRVRADYLIPYQEKLDNLRDFFEKVSTDDITTARDRKEAEKRLKDLEGDLKELRDYANEVKHIADQKIHLDLDDGVKVNYEKLGKILKKI